MKNEKITATFRTREEAIAYAEGVRMLADLCPDRDIRVNVLSAVEARHTVWRAHVQCLVHER